ncbi:zinc finger protein 91 [Trichonephila clavipes]|nr:zinc finger protein 91 [Trichonephila clavipes]
MSEFATSDLSPSAKQCYLCEICNTEFYMVSALVSHRLIHVLKVNSEESENDYSKFKEKKQHVCDICNQTCASPQKLMVHRRVHTGEKPYTCDTCKKSFNQKSSLKTHQYTHTGEKLYVCETCNKSFRTSSQLARHKLTHKNKDLACEMEVDKKSHWYNGDDYQHNVGPHMRIRFLGSLLT